MILGGWAQRAFRLTIVDAPLVVLAMLSGS